jgi:glycosyltransferase involved in cell wall biosynthesis
MNALLHLHRHVWQRLPYGLRRKVLFTATSAMAPRPPRAVRPSTPLIVAGPLRTASGLGQSARLCHDALIQAGFDVRSIDLTAALMQPFDYPAFPTIEAERCAGPGTLFLHVNAPFVPLAMVKLASVMRGKFIIGCWAWELPHTPDEWRNGVPFVHEIWVPSSFVADAVKPIALGRLVRVMPYPVAMRPASAGNSRSNPDVFNVLTLFDAASGFARKNPLASIKAFQTAFGTDPNARLTIKVARASSFPCGAKALASALEGVPNVALVHDNMTAAELDALYGNADVLISLHRAEGFGLTLAEAMVRGLPVVATEWSGNVDFLNRRTGVPIPFRMVPAEDPQRTYHYPGMMWADADTAAAAAALRFLRSDPEQRAQIGRAAAEHARRAWSTETYGAATRNYLGFE